MNGKTKLTATCSQRLDNAAPCRFVVVAFRMDGKWWIDGRESCWKHNHEGLEGQEGDAEGGESADEDDEIQGFQGDSDSEGEQLRPRDCSLRC